MLNFIMIVILVGLLAVCLLQLQKLGVIELPNYKPISGDEDESKKDE